MNWSTEPLGKLLVDGRSISYGVVQPGTHDAHGVPIIRVTDIRDSRLSIADPLRVAPDIEAQHQRTRLRGGELLLTLVGTVGETVVAPPDVAGWNTARAVGVVPVREDVGARWVHYALKAPAARSFVDARLNTTVQATLNLRDAAEIPVLMPPGPIREAILEVIESLDDKIDLNRRTCATLEAIVRATFQSWFVDFEPVKAKATGESPDSICRRLGLTRELLDLFPPRMVADAKSAIPDGWKWGTINDIARNIRDGVDPSEVDGATRYVGLEHMPRGSIVLDDWGDAAGLESGKFRFEAGHVLFGKLRPYFRKVAVAPFDGICSTDILVLDATSPGWWGLLVAYASSEDLIDYASGSSGGTRMPRTSWADIARYPIRLPREELVAEFTGRVRAIEDRCRAAVFESRTLMQLRDGLLPRLMSGELRVETEAAGE